MRSTIDSVLTNDGVLPLLSALVVVVVLRWAISSPVWRIMEEADQPPGPRPAPTKSLRPSAPAPRPARIVPPGRPMARHATTSLVRPPQVTGGPPWGPAPKPPGLP